MKNYIIAILGLVLTLNAQAEDLKITSFDSGKLTWSNRVSNAEYRVEWKPTLTDQWQTNDPVFSVTSTSNVTSIDIPMFFRVVWVNAPSIRFETLNTGMPLYGLTSFDINNDDIEDLIFRGQNLSTPDGSYSTHSIYFSGTEFVPNPALVGSLIDSNLTWQSSEVMLASRTDFLGAFTSGPWAGVTNAYLPFRLSNNSDYQYGWVHITEHKTVTTLDPIEFPAMIITQQHLRVESAAYETIPNQPILAGQTE